MPVIVDLQAKRMRDLLRDARDIGSIRRRVVNIDGSVYTPSSIPSLLEETLNAIVDKVRNIRNPVEAAFFLWVNLAYLQPFADGNKRTSRLSANMPLMLYNCAPLSFLDVERSDYATAMLGIYEQRDVSAAVDLFEFIYRRSIQKYSVLRAALSAPDPIRTKYRQALVSIAMIMVAVFILVKRDSGIDELEKITNRSLIITFVLTFLLGMYGGIYSGGYVTVLTAVLVAFFGMQFTEAVASTKLINVVSSAIATVVFMWQGLVDYSLGVILGVTMFVGAYIGAHYATKLNDLWLKRIFLTTVFVLAKKTLYDFI